MIQLFLDCLTVNNVYMFAVEGQKFRVKRLVPGKTCRFLSVNRVEPCFVYMKEAIFDFNLLSAS